MKTGLLAAASIFALAIMGQASLANPITIPLFFTTNAGGVNVWKSTATYTGNGTAGNGTFSPGTPVNLAATPGADGIVFNPNNHMLLVGGQATGKVYQVNPTTGTFTSLSAGKSIFELTVDPSKNTVWGGSSEDGSHSLTAVPINPPGGPATVVTVHGSNNTVTHIAFAPGLPAGMAFYTSGGNKGTGSFGMINLATGATTALIKNALYAHGMVYDPFTGDLILAGGDELAQINPTTDAVISTVKFKGDTLDQGAVDGKGHLFWADTGGKLLFIDYSNTKSIGSSADFTWNAFFMKNLDDLAPLVGAGSGNTGAPEPLSLTLFGGALAAFGALRRRRKS